MSIAITDEHQELGSTVRGVLQAHGALAANRALLEGDDEARPTFWREMADLGWLGIHLPEEYGGAGACLSELIVVLEETGRQVAPGPFLPTVLTSALLAQCGRTALQAALLPGLADGSVTGAVGLGGSLTVSKGCSTETPASCWAALRLTSCCSGRVTTWSSCARNRRVSRSRRARTSIPPAARPP